MTTLVIQVEQSGRSGVCRARARVCVWAHVWYQLTKFTYKLATDLSSVTSPLCKMLCRSQLV